MAKDLNDKLQDGTLPSIPINGARAYGAPTLAVPDKLTARASEIIYGNNRVSSKWHGRGKTRSGGTSPSDYDEELAYEVLKRGGSQEDAASAVYYRKNGALGTQPPAMTLALIQRVSKQLDREREQEQTLAIEAERQRQRRNAEQKARRDAQKRKDETARQAKIAEEFVEMLAVEKVVIYDTRPEPEYELHLQGTVVRFTIDEILRPYAFKKKLLCALRRVVVGMPTKQGTWERVVDSWLARADVVKEAAPASSLEVFLGLLESVVSDVMHGETAGDFKRGMLVEVKTKGVIKQWLSSLALTEKLQSSPDYSHPKLTSGMQHLGWKRGKVRIDGVELRGFWRFEPTGYDADDESCPMRVLM